MFHFSLQLALETLWVPINPVASYARMCSETRVARTGCACVQICAIHHEEILSVLVTRIARRVPSYANHAQCIILYCTVL